MAKGKAFESNTTTLLVKPNVGKSIEVFFSLKLLAFC
jgi:hypothetical protein